MKRHTTFDICLLIAFALGCQRSGEPLPGTESAPLLASSSIPAPAPGFISDRAPSDLAAETSAAEEKRKPDVIYVPTPQPVVDKMLALARVTKEDLVYDLGCGDGRIVVTAAKRYGARAIGYDIDPRRVAEARENVRESGVEHLVRIEQRDIFELDLSPATVVTLYLLPSLNVRLIPQLDRLRSGSRVVSHDFDIEGIEPTQQLSMKIDGVGHAVYLFDIPLQKQQ